MGFKPFIYTCIFNIYTGFTIAKAKQIYVLKENAEFGKHNIGPVFKYNEIYLQYIYYYSKL